MHAQPAEACHEKLPRARASSVEQADAEEALAEWLQDAGVENAFTIAPSLVEIGFEQDELKCAREYFDAKSFSDALNWLEALVSSVSLVCSIEESISRVSDLAMAVKKFAYDDRSPVKDLDVHDSLQSTHYDSGTQAANQADLGGEEVRGRALNHSYARFGA